MEVVAVGASEQPEEVVCSWAFAAVEVVRSSGPGASAEVAECSLAVARSLPAAAFVAILLALPFRLPLVQPPTACLALLQPPAYVAYFGGHRLLHSAAPLESCQQTAG